MRSVSCSTSPKGIAAIVGVGPKLGRSVARKFAHEGYTVAILARDLGKRFLSKLSRFADEIACEAKAQVFAIRIDCSDSKSVREAFEGVLSLGFVEVLVYNASEPPVTCPPTNFTAITVESFERSLAVVSDPKAKIKGILVIDCNGPHASVAGCGKFALRGLSQSLAREYQSSGIHIAHVIIHGDIGAPRSASVLAKQKTQLLMQKAPQQFSDPCFATVLGVVSDHQEAIKARRHQWIQMHWHRHTGTFICRTRVHGRRRSTCDRLPKARAS
ncbi:hypothetical protein B296_00036369 [Ensete ventricosum]|uniref:Short-chain dehydrogenase/reductase SDR n=1 Tax=Ensete ventricosum TaxID=4639 RepID=A0A426XXZ2_ENSVE|nr:hypothetical protein B296_00036369 [Ensete ventricosum]